jgi:hypothetical protein
LTAQASSSPYPSPHLSKRALLLPGLLLGLILLLVLLLGSIMLQVERFIVEWLWYGVTFALVLAALVVHAWLRQRKNAPRHVTRFDKHGCMSLHNSQSGAETRRSGRAADVHRGGCGQEVQ